MHEEEMNGKRVFVADCSELGISDFGDTLDESLDNLRNAIQLLIVEAPEKRALLEKPEQLLVTRLFL